jgi:hypothetical protein
VHYFSAYPRNKAIYSNVWRTVVNSKSPRKSATTQLQEFKVPTVINRYATLENQHEENQVQCHSYKKKLVNVKKTKTRTQQRSKTNKVLIIRDSHARGLAANLQCGHREFLVIGIVMPGAGLQIITQAAKNEIRSLNHKACIIIWSGSYDINKNESSTGLKHIRNFTLQNQHTNIIIIPALHRYDLSNSSCVNNEIQMIIIFWEVTPCGSYKN